MLKCPACQATVSPQDANCSSCGISLHHETGSSPPSASRSATGTFTIILIVVLGGLALLVCGGAASLLLFAQASVAPVVFTMETGATPESPPPSDMGFPTEDDAPMEDAATDRQSPDEPSKK